MRCVVRVAHERYRNEKLLADPVRLRDTLAHLQAFLDTPLWRDDPRLLYPLSRIAPHLAALERRQPGVLPPGLVDVLAEVTAHAKRWNHDGNWEDKLMALETALEELRALRGEGAGAGDEEGSGSKRGHGRRPSFMRSPALVPLDA